MKNFYIKFKGKKIEISNVKKVYGFQKGIGLMFSSRKKAKALLFEFEKSVKMSFTSLFVFFPFLMIWLNETNEVIDIKKIPPFVWSVSSRKPFKRVLEIPFNSDY